MSIISSNSSPTSTISSNSDFTYLLKMDQPLESRSFERSIFPQKKLGFGLMRLPLRVPTDQRSIDMSQVETMVDTFIGEGFTYFDTAYMYHDSISEKVAKEVLVNRYPHQRYSLADKMPMYDKTVEEQSAIFEDQLRKTGVGYFDYYLLHALSATSYERAKHLKTFEFLRMKKEKGIIRHLGFSFHDTADVLDRILTEHPEVEFVQLQLNYLDWENPKVQSRLCYECAARHNKAVIVMEPIKGGTLARLPLEAEAYLKSIHPKWTMAEWALKFAASLDNVMVVLSGMSDIEQVRENTRIMSDFTPLTAKDVEALHHVVQMINQMVDIPCTGCHYCVDADRCSQKIAIPEYFTLYNRQIKDPDHSYKEEYDRIAEKGYGKASDCRSCKRCEHICPQHILITQWIKKVAAKFE